MTGLCDTIVRLFHSKSFTWNFSYLSALRLALRRCLSRSWGLLSALMKSYRGSRPGASKFGSSSICACVFNQTTGGPRKSFCFRDVFASLWDLHSTICPSPTAVACWRKKQVVNILRSAILFVCWCGKAHVGEYACLSLERFSAESLKSSSFAALQETQNGCAT